MANPFKPFCCHALAGMVAAVLALWVLTAPTTGFAESAKERFAKAQSCAKALRENPKARQFRDNWLKCAEQYDALIKSDPGGAFAPAGLLAAGQLYDDLYSISGKTSDRQAALDYYRQCVKRFGKTAQGTKAAQAAEKLNPSQVPVATARQAKPPAAEPPAPKTVKPAPTPSPPVSRQDDKSPKAGRGEPPAYRQALNCRENLDRSPEKKKFRHHWIPCITAVDKAIAEAAPGQWKAAAHLAAGQLYQDLHRISKREEDGDLAQAHFQQAAMQKPPSDFSAQAQAQLKTMGVAQARSVAQPATVPDTGPVPAEQPTLPLATDGPTSEPNPVPVQESAPGPGHDQGPEQPKATAGDQALVTGLRYWSNPSYTRVVINADREVDFEHRLLKQDPSLDKPQRLYVDLSHARLGPDIERSLPINDDLLSDARAGQYSPETVRVVVDIKSIKNYKVFSMRNPFRIVLDLWGMEGVTAAPAGPLVPELVPEPPSKPPTKESLARQLALGVRRIVIDPGHGGKDFGAPGAIKGVHEKRVVLEIGKRLAEKIRKELGCEVLMTRSDDRYLTLEERTAFANTRNADLFISIHTNSARNSSAHGIETYFLNLATDQDAIEVAAMENATSTKNISDLQTILNDLMQNAKINESSRLAGHVQHALYAHLKNHYSQIKNKGVKQAPFYVLLGAQMPAILVEASFISNPEECRRLIDPAYQERICEAVIAGIRNYIKEINPGVITRQQPSPAQPQV